MYIFFYIIPVPVCKKDNFLREKKIIVKETLTLLDLKWYTFYPIKDTLILTINK